VVSEQLGAASSSNRTRPDRRTAPIDRSVVALLKALADPHREAQWPLCEDERPRRDHAHRPTRRSRRSRTRNDSGGRCATADRPPESPPPACPENDGGKTGSRGGPGSVLRLMAGPLPLADEDARSHAAEASMPGAEKRNGGPPPPNPAASMINHWRPITGEPTIVERREVPAAAISPLSCWGASLLTADARNP